MAKCHALPCRVLCHNIEVLLNCLQCVCCAHIEHSLVQWKWTFSFICDKLEWINYTSNVLLIYEFKFLESYEIPVHCRCIIASNADGQSSWPYEFSKFNEFCNIVKMLLNIFYQFYVKNNFKTKIDFTHHAIMLYE